MSKLDNKLVVNVRDFKVRIRETGKIIDYGSFSIDYGEVVLVEGPNGSGKSTFLKSLTHGNKDYSDKVSGDIEIYGRSIFDDYDVTELKQKTIYISQEDQFLSGESAYKALFTTTRYAIDDFENKKEKIEDIKKLIAYYYKEYLSPFYNDGRRRKIDNYKKDRKFMYFKRVDKLSGGQQKIIHILQGIIKAKIAGCNLVLLDEPLNNLDVDNKRLLIKLIKEVRKDNPKLTIILISHCRIFPDISATIMLNVNEAGNVNKVTYKKLDKVMETYDCLNS